MFQSLNRKVSDLPQRLLTGSWRWKHLCMEHQLSPSTSPPLSLALLNPPRLDTCRGYSVSIVIGPRSSPNLENSSDAASWFLFLFFPVGGGCWVPQVQQGNPTRPTKPRGRRVAFYVALFLLAKQRREFLSARMQQSCRRQICFAVVFFFVPNT